MKNNFFNNYPILNVYEKPSKKSNLSTQILYGEEFKLLNKKKNYLKIKTVYDNYTGFIKNRYFLKEYKPNYKIRVLKAQLFKLPFRNKFSKNFIPFLSKVEVTKKYKNYYMIGKNKWIKKNDLVKIEKKELNFKKILKLFVSCKYLWGGKTYKGIDCSAILQLLYKFNNISFPRDTKDQINYKKGTIKEKFKKGDIIFWKGHVAICIDSRKLIHAYGPAKKVIEMPIKETIKIINKTANLKVKKIYSI